ncbi:endoplasmic reticulum aminopeptidase 1-like isoform X2 [Clavelina lepadiformis]|uniref:endoplasmic reticulum aminopeptidase 1-like isoform X2 n=1 Tax=Clavelina lepadiformis TaxID=159417 RepID=UPI00404192D3
MSWHRIPDHENSEEDETIMMTSVGEDDTTAHLLREDASVVHRRELITNINNMSLRRRLREGMRSRPSLSTLSKRAKEERKYKYSLVSVLVIGICLIMMVNIGLGYRKCESTNEEMYHPPEIHKLKQCIDSATGLPFPWQNYRLPTNLLPEDYHIFLHPNLTLQKYTAQVAINFSADKTTDYVILHSRGHTFKRVQLGFQNSKEKHLVKQTLHCSNNEMVAFKFGQVLNQGQNYQIVLDFYGNLTFSLGGFYLSKYKRNNGKEVVIGTTQFESLDARAAFPCFDEPAFKANFSLSMVREPSFKTLFNMPIESTNDYEGGLKIDNFGSTVKMSTYLVAFIVSDFQNVSNVTAGGVEVSIYSSPDKISETEFALKMACDVLDAYENLFNIPFPLPKMDLVAVPDFAAGAMENWGLVTYRETALLYNPATSSIKDQEWVATVIAHELSHQWFGNLVTMEWWNDLWLNEGFASYMEYYGVDMIHPKWKFFADFSATTVTAAMTQDSSQFTHALSFPVTDSRKVDEMFDSISYNKGASIIMMLKDFIGDEFFDGVRDYLMKHAYGNAENQDLVAAVAARDTDNNGDIQAMINAWTTLAGVPIVKVTLKDNKVSVEQSRFMYPDGSQNLPETGLWHIPLTYVTNISPQKATRKLLTQKSSSFDVPKVEWIKFNHNRVGYYRVAYDKGMWNMLINQLSQDHEVFSASDRVSLISDAFVAARVGNLNYQDAFRFASYLQSEKDYAPLILATTHLGYIDEMLKVGLKEEQRRMYEKYVTYIFTPLYYELAWKNKTSLSRMQLKLQSTIVSLMCSYKYEPCLTTAYAKFRNWKENNVLIEAEYMTTVFQSAIHHNLVEDWDFMWNAFVNTTDALLSNKLLSSIGMTTNLQKIIFLQEEMLKGENIRSQSASSLIVSLTSNMVGGSLTWRFVKQHWDEIVKLHPVASFAMRSIVLHCLTTILDEGEIVGAEAFFKSKGIDDMQYVKRTLEKVRINIQWFKQHASVIGKWLKQNENSWHSDRP